MQTLHILNGDATRPEFEKAGIAGEILIWREMLVEGPTVAPILSAEWFRLRRRFVQVLYADNNPHAYDKAETELRRLAQSAKQFTEIVLWFEYDLFCQINLIAALSALKELGVPAQRISLVCPGEHAEIEDFRGLGQLRAAHFTPLYAERVSLNPTSLHFADRVYQAYASADPRSLEALLQEPFPPVFPFLQAALQLHLQRFPGLLDGLAQEERELLELLKVPVESERQWVGKMLRNDAQRGFGDAQYFQRVDRLRPLIDSQEQQVALNDLGKAVLAGEQNFLSVASAMVPIGGANGRRWRWNPATQEIVGVRGN